MKVDVWIYTDNGAEDHRENLTNSQAIGFIMNAAIEERVYEIFTGGLAKDTISDIIGETIDETMGPIIEKLTKGKEDEDNEN